MMKKENQRIRITKKLMQDALLRLMEKKPLDSINITELCNESGINRATFYRHYTVPRDILLEMEMNFIEEANVRFDLTETTDISKYLEGLCEYMYKNAELVKIFVSNNSQEDFAVLINNMFDKFVKRKKLFLDTHGIEQSNLRLISAYISGGGYFMIRSWLLEDIQKTPKEVAELILAFMNYTTTFFEKKN